MNASDRRRLVFATVFTVVALPALWVTGRDQARTTTAPSAGAAGLAAPSGGVHSTAVTTTYEPQSPVFLGSDRGAQTAIPPLISVEHGTDQAGNHADVRAAFRRYNTTNACTTPYAAGGVTIKVTNIDNGQSITCRNVLGPVIPAGDGILVHTELLAEIANLADAPISVRISW
ncbi:MAG: hypothetical protein JWM12_4118 [Ilumatobacteraceae bacterium]|jgi:hypothetical protein|nr:hypothetical protein [Ilumatobacteraceae bacterium]